ncbi:hypothetical protein AB7M47_008615 [Bradyrhizobium elkanii]
MSTTPNTWPSILAIIGGDIGCCNISAFNRGTERHYPGRRS